MLAHSGYHMQYDKDLWIQQLESIQDCTTCWVCGSHFIPSTFFKIVYLHSQMAFYECLAHHTIILLLYDIVISWI